MRAGFSFSMDYNQMLVVSVVLHLLAIMVIMFLPKPKISQKRIVPAFNVEVLEIPSRRIGEPRQEPKAELVKPVESPPPTVAEEIKPVETPKEAPPVKPVEPQPLKKKEIPKAKAPAPKPVVNKAPPKPLEKPTPKTSKIVEELERLEVKPETGIINELDKLAKLEPKKPAPETNRKVEKPQTPPPAKVNDTEKELPKTEDSSEAEFDNLAKKNLNVEQETREKTAMDLAEDLKRQMLLDSFKSIKVKPGASPKQVDLSVVSRPAFDSSLRKLEIHDNKKALPEGRSASPLPHPKSSSSDPLSLYAGMVEDKIYSNWKSPLGAKSKEVYVSFFIFPKGNVGKPFVEKSSGNEQLDALAIRAILDSEPFLPFPGELKEPSLHFTIHFKYIPEG